MKDEPLRQKSKLKRGQYTLIEQEQEILNDEKYRILFENTFEAYMVIQNQEIKVANPMAQELTGYSVKELLSMSIPDLISPEDNISMIVFYKKRLMDEKEHGKQEFRIVRKDGVMRWVEFNAIKILWNDQPATLNYIIDITDRKKAEKESLVLSYLDELTGVYNKNFYEQELTRLNTENKIAVTLILARVKGLKVTNDTFGYEMGDQLLITTAKIMKNESRAVDRVARIGADEFVLLLQETNSVVAELVVNRMREAIDKTKLDRIILSVSFGWATKNHPDEQLEKLFTEAQKMLYAGNI
ncbi:sensor domain-containing diguanylate cyclase [Acetobacterium bakii]|uniref:Diguanylate cyclase n=1 Tax=Acetobacterium bakii TaxID=52689 RepID=A0A0L6U1T9_9FIRM|nr:sensor domain-containing diguanylate cyclase [Acetobacterium bakii]KNZ42474.1 hypothetical protein AKG39_05985 [Acetobacterium bakii]